MKQRVSKNQWLEMGLELLEREGIGAVRVDRLARELGTSRSGFYWHFKDRSELYRDMLEYWAHEDTEVVANNPELQHGSPKGRLRKTMEMILEHDLTRYDLAIRGWAKTDPKVAKAFKHGYRLRHEFIGARFAEMGFEGADLEMRTRLLVTYESWEVHGFPFHSKKSMRELIPLRLELLTRK